MSDFGKCCHHWLIQGDPPRGTAFEKSEAEAVLTHARALAIRGIEPTPL